MKNDAVQNPLLEMIIESIQETKTESRVLYDIVCRGHDGQQSVLTRISVLERSDKDKEERIVDMEKFQIQFKIEDRKTKIYIFWLLITVIIMILVAIILDTSNLERVKWLIDIFK
mgnify:CR=1 FL=1